MAETTSMAKSFVGQTTDDQGSLQEQPQQARSEEELGAGQMACPACGSAMPDLKGGRATICPVCGFKDSCCF